MTLQQHIDELRAELEWNEDPAEIRQIKAELEAAQRERASTARVMTARGPSAIEFAEALVLADVLLEPRGRRSPSHS